MPACGCKSVGLDIVQLAHGRVGTNSALKGLALKPRL